MRGVVCTEMMGLRWSGGGRDDGTLRVLSLRVWIGAGIRQYGRVCWLEHWKRGVWGSLGKHWKRGVCLSVWVVL